LPGTSQWAILAVMILPILLVSTLQSAGAQWGAVSADGRIAFERDGHILVMREGAPASRVTGGIAIDRQPAWTPDGRWLVFASDRGGGLHLWRIAINDLSATGMPEQLTRSPEADSEPAVSADGSIVFVRGSGSAADLWIRANDGTEKKLTSAAGTERSPAVSRDGIVAYVAIRVGRRQLRAIRLDGSQDRSILAEPGAEFPAWSPAGDRLAFVSVTGRRPIMITNPEGTYTNTVSLRRGRPVWLNDQTLLVSELQTDGPGYNGDPERFDRDGGREAAFAGGLWRVSVPAAPDANRTDVAMEPVPSTSQDRTIEFDRMWQRVDALYFNRPDRATAHARWQQVKNELEPRAASTSDLTAFAEVWQEALRRRPPLREEASGRSAISSAHPLATEAGLEILRKGGNVVDAAVAVSFALGVVEPDASGVGGYGQMLIHSNGTPDPVLLEFMSRAPEAATLDNSALADPNLPGAAKAIVPGTVDGMHRAWQRFGSKKLKWAELLEPAIKLAEQGFVLDDAFPTTLRREQDEYLKNESTRALFFKDGKPLSKGDTFKNPDLAWTLKQIAQGGAEAFYRGEIAQRMVADLRPKGNVMSLRDLGRYFAEWREPVSTTYRGHTVFSSAPPVSGGALLAAQLNTLENYGSPKLHTEDAATAHAMIEAWKLAPRGRIADPSLWPVDISPATSKDSARARWSCFFNANRAVPARDISNRTCHSATTDVGSESRELSEQASSECDVSELDRHCRATGTTSFAVADAAGNMVAVTQTLGTWGGNFYVTPGLGFLYNDKLGSYGNSPDAFGARIPFARHGSTIAPTLLFRGTGKDRKPLLATGAAGNAWINAAVYQIVTGVIDHKLGPQQALELPRFLPGSQAGPDGQNQSVLQIESGYAPSVITKLETLGHRFNLISLPGELRMGYGAAVMVDRGEVRAGADPRRSGAAGAVK
jgi:gamma-glutamyltranspeptidase / glutathione hydrolase